jgi:hypothetical protein
MLRTQAQKIVEMRRIAHQTGNVEIYNAATLALERLAKKAYQIAKEMEKWK